MRLTEFHLVVERLAHTGTCIAVDSCMRTRVGASRETAHEAVLKDYLASDQPLDIEGWGELMPNAVEAKSLFIHDRTLGVEATFEKHADEEGNPVCTTGS
jgi:hypothetical protein